MEQDEGTFTISNELITGMFNQIRDHIPIFGTIILLSGTIIYRGGGRDLNDYEQNRPLFFGTLNSASLYSHKTTTDQHVLYTYQTNNNLLLQNITHEFLYYELDRLISGNHMLIASLLIYAFNIYSETHYKEVKHFFKKYNSTEIYNDRDNYISTKPLVSRQACVDLRQHFMYDSNLVNRLGIRYSVYEVDKPIMSYYNYHYGSSINGFVIALWSNISSHEIILFSTSQKPLSTVLKLIETQTLESEPVIPQHISHQRYIPPQRRDIPP